MINKVGLGNLYNLQAFKGINAAPSVQRRLGAEVTATKQTSGNPFLAAVSNSSMFSGNTAGVNTNIGIGDSSYIAPQAGMAGGIGRTIAFA